MNDQPPSMLEAQKIVASWPSMPSASSEEDAGSIDLLDALSPLLEQAPAELRAALLSGDPQARGAMAALRKLFPDILSGVIDALRERVGAGDCQGTLERIPVLEALGRAAGNDSALGEAEYLRGYAFRRLGQKYRAIDAYQKALAHGGDIAFRSRTLDRLGNLQIEVGAFDDAEASYETALGIETDPGGQAAILRNIANAKRCLGDFSAAGDADRQAAILCGTSAKDGYALDAAAQSFSEIGDHPWALELNSRAKSWFEKNSPVGLPVNAEIRVALLHKAGRPRDAEAQFRVALGLFDVQARATIDAAHYVEGWRQGVAVRVPPYSPLMLAYALATKTCAAPAVQQVIANAQKAGDIGLALRARAL
ncbi:MAG: tetratricopeptide repeat protein, partial [Alphaproteobacteria bacterium]|nr:tetratricopeptide repeat protein [Alphaproteobacteria bacterium]